ncbi:ABC transporter ATP-binding protein [Haliangium sp.]|uniref:ABC transporter ATP-binding protein n=1 Tax=Haliangium sp. TaxID=2663208 RepID=UPI003D0BF584
MSDVAAHDGPDTRAPAPSSRGGASIELIGLRRGFGGVRVLDGLDLSVPAGQFLAVLGPSGCGKSTLLRLVAGLDRADAGEIRIDAQAVRAGARAQRTSADIAFVFQEAHLLPWRTLIRNVELPLELAGVAADERRRRALAVIDQVGLGDAAQRYPAELSGGMSMRASLARALVTDPAVLLLDEPFAALDEITRQRLDGELYALWRARSITVIFVTHAISEAVFLAQRAIMLSRGPARVIADRSIDLPPQRERAMRNTPAFGDHVSALYDALLVAEEGR